MGKKYFALLIIFVSCLIFVSAERPPIIIELHNTSQMINDAGFLVNDTSATFINLNASQFCVKDICIGGWGSVNQTYNATYVSRLDVLNTTIIDSNSSWLSTYNATYVKWAYNQTAPAIAYSEKINVSALSINKTANIQNLLNDTSMTFTNLNASQITIIGSIFPSVSGMTVPLPSVGSSNPVFDVLTQSLLGIFFNRTASGKAQIDFGKGTSQTHTFTVLGAESGNAWHKSNLTIGGDLNFGSYTAGEIAVDGYITIYDNTGTKRLIPVSSP